jgi:hypothetical protein
VRIEVVRNPWDRAFDKIGQALQYQIGKDNQQKENEKLADAMNNTLGLLGGQTTGTQPEYKLSAPDMQLRYQAPQSTLPKFEIQNTVAQAPGNINLNNRPVVNNADGSISTVRSMSVNMDGKEVLIPTISDDGRVLTPDQAVAQYKQTGKHLGVFNTPDEATAYAKQLSAQQGQQYGAQPKSLTPPNKLSLADQYRPQRAQAMKQLVQSGMNPRDAAAYVDAEINRRVGDQYGQQSQEYFGKMLDKFTTTDGMDERKAFMWAQGMKQKGFDVDPGQFAKLYAAKKLEQVNLGNRVEYVDPTKPGSYEVGLSPYQQESLSVQREGNAIRAANAGGGADSEMFTKQEQQALTRANATINMFHSRWKDPYSETGLRAGYDKDPLYQAYQQAVQIQNQIYGGKNGGQAKPQITAAQIDAARANGYSDTEIAAKLGVSVDQLPPRSAQPTAAQVPATTTATYMGEEVTGAPVGYQPQIPNFDSVDDDTQRGAWARTLRR